MPPFLPLLLAATVFLLYGATHIFPAPHHLLRHPIQPPHLSQCFPISVSPSTPVLNCCMPATSPDLAVEFRPPPSASPLRIRPAAHLVGPDYVSRYARAVQLMKDLPYADPRSFAQQTNVHCAYCNGAYDQAGFANLELLIHRSWLFFPWHRLYLYFHERILAKLLDDDDSFALPFWNWDSPDGMQMPSMYVAGSTNFSSRSSSSFSSLFHPKRDPSHSPPAMVDLNLFETRKKASTRLQSATVEENLWIMHRQVVANGATAEMFMGSPFRAGEQPEPGPGSLESIPHNTIHSWTGDPRRSNNEDMGAFYSAARDPIFYAHHANIDRLWLVWKSMGGRRRDFADDDWLDAAFFFYDEEARLVRVTVRDSLDTERLRYRYQEVENHWINASRRPTMKEGRVKLTHFPSFPVMLKRKEVAVMVRRPGRMAGGGDDSVEVLVVEGIENEWTESVRFDVYVDAMAEDGKIPAGRRWAGSFVRIPQVRRGGNGGEAMAKKKNLKLGIGELIEEVGAAADDSVLVTLVPVKGTAIVAGVSIVFL